MKSFSVAIVQEAEEDLDVIYNFITRADGIEQANRIEDRLMEAILSLGKTPARGKCPAEMRLIGVNGFKELQSSPWRIFYYLEQDTVFVVAVLDGRRNIAEILRRRLLR